ncbi:MAG: pyrroline-5-carboxylate reductase [Bdellovibrionales bacterium]|nr:pyrroline-5-carboxylate reductase [Bdellovibrionales bacterium]
MQTWIHSFIKAKKIGVLGAGNLSRSILSGFLKSGVIDLKDIYVTNRNPEKLHALQAEFPGLQVINSSAELIENCGIIILGVKPQDIVTAVESVRGLFTNEHIVVSLAAGVSLASLKSLIPGTEQLVRWMPNTPLKIQEGVVGYSVLNESETLAQLSEKLLSPLGLVVPVEEGDEMNALTIACASGPAFIYEFIMIWQSWLESSGFPSNISREMALQTFLGTVKLAADNKSLNLTDLQNQVMSKKGTTHAGLMHLRSLEVENLIAASFNKAVNRAREIEQDFDKEIHKN